MRELIALVRCELWQRRWAILWWSIGIGVFITLNLSVYPSFRDQAAELNKSYSQLPQSVRDLFSDTGDFISPSGYLSSQVFYLMLPLLFSLLCVGMGGSLIAKEEQNKTIELLLARPVSRGKLLAGKALAGLIVAAAVGCIIGVLCAVEVRLIGFAGVSTLGVLVATGMALLLGVLFGSLAFALTALGAAGRGLSIIVAAAVGLGGYVISSLDGTVHWLRWPAKLLPYHYYGPAQFLGGTYRFGPAIAFMAVIALLAFVAWFGFRRRDIA